LKPVSSSIGMEN